MPINNKNPHKLRMEIAQIAAKFVAVDGVNDFFTAKRKAASQIGVDSKRHMPTNREIEQALINYQQLFQQNQQQEWLHELRLQALKAMQLLAQYQPLLTGPVLKGSATQHSEITLHLFCDEQEQIGFLLNRHAIPFTNIDKPVKINPSSSRNYPGYRFIANESKIILIVFPEKSRWLTPISTIDDKPMQRAAISDVQALLNTAL